MSDEDLIARRMFFELHGCYPEDVGMAALSPIEDQPPPVANASRPIWDLVREDADRRRYDVTCRHCGEGFEGHSASRFCSDRCMFMANASPSSHSACWLWRGKSGDYQYLERVRGERVGAHVFAYLLFWGSINEGNVIRHMCHEKACVNPFHLVQGTPAQNSRDMTDARRQAHCERHGQAKLTEEAVREIRADEDATDAELAARYSVSRRAIRLARTGRTWKLLDQVDNDMAERDRVGRERYGNPLQANNGRDGLIDLYQELLDATVYARQMIEERAAGRTVPVLPHRQMQETEIERLKIRIDELLEHNTNLRLELRATDRKRMVREFHAKFDQVIGTEPKVPDEKLARFRLALIVEEFIELLDASLESPREEPWTRRHAFEALMHLVDRGQVKIDFVRFVDGLIDLAYVLEGTCVSLGIDSTPLWREVQRSNLEKAGKDERGKIKKPEGWTAPDILGELRKQGYKP